MGIKKQVSLKHEYYKECPECKGKLTEQDKWNELFDRYDVNTPAMDLVINRLHSERVPRFICDDCQLEILVR